MVSRAQKAGDDGVNPVRDGLQQQPQLVPARLFQPLEHLLQLVPVQAPVPRGAVEHGVGHLAGGPDGAAHAADVPGGGMLGDELLQLLLHGPADGPPLLLGGVKLGDVLAEQGQGAHRQAACALDGPVPVGDQLGGAAAQVGQQSGVQPGVLDGPRKDSSASSRPVSTSIPQPGAAITAPTASSVLEMFRRDAVANTRRSGSSRLSMRER